MIAGFNRVISGTFDVLMTPFAVSSAWPGVIFVSLLTAAMLVALFALTANPAGILRARNRFLARTLELLLFQHDLRVSLTAVGRLLWANLVYLGQFVKPMAAAIVPLVLIFGQLEAWFDRRPLITGETAVVTVAVDSQRPVLTTPIDLQAPATIRIDAPIVHTPTRNEVAWRIVAEANGAEPIHVAVDGRKEPKSLIVGANLARVSPRREAAGFLGALRSPSEAPLSASGPIRRIEISYPPRELTIGLTEIHWLVAAIVLMMAFSLLLGALFGVKIA